MENLTNEERKIINYSTMELDNGIRLGDKVAALIAAIGAVTAADILISDIENNFTATDVEGALTELFTSVSSGKTLIAGAITDKGVETSATDTFPTIATNISNISTFAGCTGLTNITLGGVGNAMTSISATAFSGCTQAGLTINVYVDDPAAPSIASSAPWGATNAVINYLQA